MKEKYKFWRIPIVFTIAFGISLLMTVVFPVLFYYISGGYELSAAFSVFAFVFLLYLNIPLAVAVFAIWLFFVIRFFALKCKNE